MNPSLEPNLHLEALTELDKALGIIHEYLPEFWTESGCRDIQIENTKRLSIVTNLNKMGAI